MDFEYSDEWRDALLSLHKRLLDNEIEIYDELEELVFKAENTTDPRVVFTLAECLHKFFIEGLDESIRQTLGLVDPLVYYQGAFKFSRQCIDEDKSGENEGIEFSVTLLDWCGGGGVSEDKLRENIFPLAKNTFSLTEMAWIVEYWEEFDFPENGLDLELSFYHFFKQQVEAVK